MIEVDEAVLRAFEEGSATPVASNGSSAAGLFDAFEAPRLRAVFSAQATTRDRAVVSSKHRSGQVLGDGNGRRTPPSLQHASGDGQPTPAANWLPAGTVPPWFEIVGVVRDLGMAVEPNPNTAGAYFPLNLRNVGSVMVAARVSGDMAAATNALRSVAKNVDPTLRVSDVQPLSRIPERGVNLVCREHDRIVEGGDMLALSGIYA